MSDYIVSCNCRTYSDRKLITVSRDFSSLSHICLRYSTQLYFYPTLTSHRYDYRDNVGAIWQFDNGGIARRITSEASSTAALMIISATFQRYRSFGYRSHKDNRPHRSLLGSRATLSPSKIGEKEGKGKRVQRERGRER